MKFLLNLLSIAIVGIFAVFAFALFVPPPATQPDQARVEACAPFGEIAARSWELNQRGMSRQVALAAATSRVSEAALLPMVRDAVDAGFSTRTEAGARERAVSFCVAGNLGR